MEIITAIAILAVALLFRHWVVILAAALIGGIATNMLFGILIGCAAWVYIQATNDKENDQ
jgi:hypothetical protein